MITDYPKLLAYLKKIHDMQRCDFLASSAPSVQMQPEPTLWLTSHLLDQHCENNGLLNNGNYGTGPN